METTQRHPKKQHLFPTHSTLAPCNGEDYSDESTTQLSINGMFAGFLYACVECGTRALHLEDGRCDTCNGKVDNERARRDVMVRAQLLADQAIRVMTMAGHWVEAFGMSDAEVGDFAAKAARQCFRLCLKYQVELGGHPADGGEKV